MPEYESARDEKLGRLTDICDEQNLTLTVSFTELSVLIRGIDTFAKQMTDGLEERLQKVMDDQGREAAVEMARFVKDSMHAAKRVRDECIRLGDEVMERIKSEDLVPQDQDRAKAKSLLVGAKMLD